MANMDFLDSLTKEDINKLYEIAKSLSTNSEEELISQLKDIKKDTSGKYSFLAHLSAEHQNEIMSQLKQLFDEEKLAKINRIMSALKD
jgi:cytochrome c553